MEPAHLALLISPSIYCFFPPFFHFLFGRIPAHLATEPVIVFFLDMKRNLALTAPLQSIFPFYFPPNLATVYVRLQHEIYCLFNGVIVQAIYFLFSCLNLQNRPGEPNVAHRHTPPDLPPRSILRWTERSIVSPLYSSLTSVLKLSPEELCTSRNNRANLGHKFKFIVRCCLRE
jgi:hypothetical protein